MLLLDFDKAGAEWVIVAYLTGDARMIEVVESGKSPHVVTASEMFGLSEEIILKENKIVDKATDAETITKLRAPIAPLLKNSRIGLPRTMSIRQAGKKTNHGCNYREGYKMFALINEITETEAKPMVEAYSTVVYPGIANWWEQIDEVLRTSRTFINCFGRKIRFLEEMGPELKKSATSFLPQSTVVDMVNLGLCQAFEDTTPPFWHMDLLTQTHDSLTFQYPTDDWTRMAEFAIKISHHYLSAEVEYNFRKFKVGTDMKVGLNWSDMVEVRVTDDVGSTERNLREAWDSLNGAKAG